MRSKVTNTNGGLNSVSLEDAMMMTGFGLYNVRHVLLSGLILMGVVMQSLSLGQVLPAARCDLHLSAHLTGMVASVPFVAIILMSYLWGWLADVRGRRLVMLYCLPVTVLFSIAASFAPEPISFSILVFASGIFFSAPAAIIYTYLGELNNAKHRDKIVTFGSSFIGVGTVVLPALSWLILPLEIAYEIPPMNIVYRSWRLLIVACTLPHAVGFVMLYFSPESPKFLYSQGRYEECLAVLRKIYALNKWKSEDSFPVNTLIVDENNAVADEKKKPTGVVSVLISMRDHTVPLFQSPLLPWTCLTCFVQFGIFAGTNGFLVWFPTILNAMASDGQEMRICEVLHRNQTGIKVEYTECDNTINTATFEQSIYIGLVFTSMYFIVAPLVDVVGKKRILVATLVITGLAGATSHLVTSRVAVALFAVFQMSGACVGLMNAAAVQLFPTEYRALAICLSMIVARVGSIVGTTVIGILLDVRCDMAFYLFGGLVVVNGLSCLTLPGKVTTNLHS